MIDVHMSIIALYITRYIIWSHSVISAILSVATMMSPRLAAERLSVPLRADEKQLRRAYRRAALGCHPDKEGSATEFQQLKDALEVLLSAQKAPQAAESERRGLGVYIIYII